MDEVAGRSRISQKRAPDHGKAIFGYFYPKTRENDKRIGVEKHLLTPLSTFVVSYSQKSDCPWTYSLLLITTDTKGMSFLTLHFSLRLNIKFQFNNLKHIAGNARVIPKPEYFKNRKLKFKEMIHMQTNISSQTATPFPSQRKHTQPPLRHRQPTMWTTHLLPAYPYKRHSSVFADKLSILYTVEDQHGILTFNGRMFSLPHFHFPFKSVNIYTILTYPQKIYVYIWRLVLEYHLEYSLMDSCVKKFILIACSFTTVLWHTVAF